MVRYSYHKPYNRKLSWAPTHKNISHLVFYMNFRKYRCSIFSIFNTKCSHRHFSLKVISYSCLFNNITTSTTNVHNLPQNYSSLKISTCKTYVDNVRLSDINDILLFTLIIHILSGIMCTVLLSVRFSKNLQ